MEGRGSVILDYIKYSMENIAFAAMINNDTVEELACANARLTDTVQISQGDNYKYITMLGLCKPTNARDVCDNKPNYYPEGYCWLHGLKVCLDHNIVNCNIPQAGHKQEANRDNNIEGKKWNENWTYKSK